MSLARHSYHYVDNQEGWQLEVKQCHPPKRLIKKRRPLCIIRGYGMNSHIFGYHPSGLSMESYFVHEGFEVWSVNLRGQGGTKWVGGERNFGLYDLGITDLSYVVTYILDHASSTAGHIDLIGCSLGGTLAYMYAALVKGHRAGALVGMGAPLRWERVHPLLRLAFASPTLVGKIPIVGVRDIMRVFWDRIKASPLLKIYCHPEIVDLSDKEELLKTIENPVRQINHEIAEWVKNKDLIIDDRNLTEAFHNVTNPLLCVLANADGIVPPLTALSSHEVAKSVVKDTLVVGTEDLHYAHADLFLSHHSHVLVFQPIAHWLKMRYR